MIWLFLRLTAVALLLPTCRTVDVAVCVGGQTGRMLPAHLSSLFEGNPGFRFHLFYILQRPEEYHAPVIYNTEVKRIFRPAKYVNMTDVELMKDLTTLYSSYSNTKIVDIRTMHRKTRETWLKELRVADIDRVRKPHYAFESIINMYAKRVECIQMLAEYENKYQTVVDYIMYAREDLYFFHPMNLSFLLPHLHNGALHNSLETVRRQRMEEGKDDADGDRKDHYSRCDYLAKGYLQWGGVNMRLSIMTRSAGVKYYGNFIHFYQSLYALNRTAENSEKFDLMHLKSLGMKACGFTSRDFPVTSARHVNNGSFCFINAEIDSQKDPPASLDFISRHRCHLL